CQQRTGGEEMSQSQGHVTSALCVSWPSPFDAREARFGVRRLDAAFSIRSQKSRLNIEIVGHFQLVPLSGEHTFSECWVRSSLKPARRTPRIIRRLADNPVVHITQSRKIGTREGQM
ncbi:MAG: hypothetical protein ACRD6I_10365, partial [Candidatus Acidiferrales bacterium]